MNDVTNKRTGSIQTYSLPPREALVAAWEQGRGNFNTWLYQESECPIEEGRWHLFAGDYAVSSGRLPHREMV